MCIDLPPHGLLKDAMNKRYGHQLPTKCFGKLKIVSCRSREISLTKKSHPATSRPPRHPSCAEENENYQHQKMYCNYTDAYTVGVAPGATMN